TDLQTHAQYDQCGSVRKTWDAKDTALQNPIQISYLDSFYDGAPRNTYAYPTSMITAVPYSSGLFASTSGLTSSTKYDFNTGRVMSSKDANDQTTSYDYTDPLNRLKLVTRPDAGTTTYVYDVYNGKFYVETLTKQDATRNI